MNQMTDCCADTKALPFQDAKNLIQNTIKQLTETEVIAIETAHGRVLQEDIISHMHQPPKDNSAMDGYALNSNDCKHGTVTLKVIGKAFAGSPFHGELKPGEAVRIMTGAPIPKGADAVIMQEAIFDHLPESVVTEQLSEITLTEPVTSGQNIRLKGNDIKEGDCILKKGTYLNAGAIGLLASIGVAKVKVTRKIRVTILSTGDEVQNLGETLKEGNIYDANRYALIGLLQDPCIQITQKEKLDDNHDHMCEYFSTLKKDADLIITTGAVSVGEADWIKPVVSTLGEIVFWRVNIKPGKPVSFAKLDGTLFFGLPGNPVSVMVTFLQFVRPALWQLAGNQAALSQPKIKATLTHAIKKKSGRMEFQRGILSLGKNGKLYVENTGSQSSGVLSSMAKANCLILLPEAQADLTAGDLVDVQLLPDTKTVT